MTEAVGGFRQAGSRGFGVLGQEQQLVGDIAPSMAGFLLRQTVPSEQIEDGMDEFGLGFRLAGAGDTRQAIPLGPHGGDKCLDPDVVQLAVGLGGLDAFFQEILRQ